MAKILLTIMFLLSCAGCAAKGPFHYEPARWMRDKDRMPITMPKSAEKYTIQDVADKELFQEYEKVISMAQGVTYSSSSFVSGRQEALNINNFDETFDSTWFTNRLGRYDMSVAEIVRGPNVSGGPNLSSPLRVKGAKVSGVVPRILVEDRNGRHFLLKFDPPGLDGLATGSELITSLLMHAAGYNVPENYIINISAKNLILDPNAKTRGKYGKIREMTKEDLNLILEKITGGHSRPFRAIATRAFPGKIIGPFSFDGRLYGDLNDRIPHQHRRELRGYRVFSSFVNNIDSVAYDTMDTFTNVEDKKGYIVHHLFDLSSTFGGVGSWQKKDKKWEEKTSAPDSLLQAFTLGLYDKEEPEPAPEDVGFLGVGSFNPARWNTSYPNAAFAFMTYRDAFWAARIIMLLSDDAIKAIVKQAKYPNAKITKYVTDALIARKNIIGKYWFSKINPLDNFEIVQNDSLSVKFDDLAVEYGFEDPANTTHQYSLRTQFGRAQLVKFTSINTNMITFGDEVLKHLENGRIYLLKIETRRRGMEYWMRPVDLYIKKSDKGFMLLGFIRR